MFMLDVPTSKKKFRILSKTDANTNLQYLPLSFQNILQNKNIGTNYKVGWYFIPYLFITAISNNIYNVIGVLSVAEYIDITI